MRIVVNRDRREVRVDGEPVEVTRKQLDVMVYLDAHRDRPRTSKEITRALWGGRGYYTDDLARWHIHRLRRKLGRDAIVSSRYFGYVLAA